MACGTRTYDLGWKMKNEKKRNERSGIRTHNLSDSKGERKKMKKKRNERSGIRPTTSHAVQEK